MDLEWHKGSIKDLGFKSYYHYKKAAKLLSLMSIYSQNATGWGIMETAAKSWAKGEIEKMGVDVADVPCSSHGIVEFYISHIQNKN